MDACYDKIATHSRDGVDDDMLELLKQFVRITLENAWLTEKIVSVEHKIENKQELQQASRKGKEEEPFGAPLGTKGKQGEQKKAEQLEEAKQLLYSLQHGDGTTSIEDVLRNNEKDVKLIEGLTPFKERHVNRQLSKENEFTVLKHAAEEAQLTELLKDEVETWKDYVRQEKKLKKKMGKGEALAGGAEGGK
ncbi:hypothetical protein AGDE_16506 [Angomonas deanei]|uniref:Uncharacterized protein n=1 Tax=Angomonas deanei TaxID=59799 RepID=A0A7G2CK05_9TRYP|nr:hypothetical protein AGDE_16506 [Angomonas deanei]CAD2219281.1 hypothetical protein, conserved [Angomonas deanei]|eukprot:EPY16985.1 hypothetical protein AGDE_16506 [Angomonas deanei]